TSLSCLDCEQPVASPTEDTQYTLTIYDENNCESQAQIWVRVDDNKNIYVPNVFSPDDDGLNDKFTLLTVDGPVQEVETFKVYDRWGNLVYEANHFDPLDEDFGWNGRYKGKLMDSAVFIYYIKIKFIDGTEEELKGGVTLAK
ncbi:MAG: gliding motility-associated C-terminal domain-containing protein, partial [Saprospiraceae bacterium]